MLPIHWGKLEDMTIYGDQLVSRLSCQTGASTYACDRFPYLQIAASYAQTNVSLWCVDLKVSA